MTKAWPAPYHATATTSSLVPVGMRSITAYQGRYDIAQRRQGEVDLGGLLQPLPGCARLALPLTAGQVHQVQLANLC